jgi:hypothetical protein
MHFAERVGPDRPDPMETWRERARALGISVAGLAPQPNLEDWGISGVQADERTDNRRPVLQSASFSRMYTVFRNPDDRDDPVNRADVDEALREALDRPVPDDLPEWMVRLRERMLYPMLWDAVRTHWFAAAETGQEQRDVADLLTAHVDHVLRNRFRAEHGLGDPIPERWASLVQREAVRAGDVVVGGAVATGGAIIDTDPFVIGLGAPLADGRVLTAVLPRTLLGLVTVQFVADAPY